MKKLIVHRNNRNKILFCLVSLVTMVLFQNCAKNPASMSAPEPAAAAIENSGQTESVVGVTADLDQISYNSAINGKIYSKEDLQNRRLVDVSLSSGAFVITEVKTQTKRECKLSVEQEQKLKALLSISRICQPVVDKQKVVCMALPAGEDVVLSNDQRKVGLAKVICQNGTYLCDGNDDKLRAELELIRQASTDGCKSLP